MNQMESDLLWNCHRKQERKKEKEETDLDLWLDELNRIEEDNGFENFIDSELDKIREADPLHPSQRKQNLLILADDSVNVIFSGLRKGK